MSTLVWNAVAKSEKSDTKCSAIHFLFFAFRERFRVFCDKCIASLRVWWPTTVSQLYVSSDGGWGMWVNDTRTTTIYSKRGMFSALFNPKTNTVQRIVWFLYTVKEIVRGQGCQVIMRKIRVHVWKAIRRRLKNL